MGSDDYSMTSCSGCKANKTESFDNTELDSKTDLSKFEKMASEAESLVSNTEDMDTLEIDDSASEGMDKSENVDESESMSEAEGNKRLNRSASKLLKKVDAEYRRNIKIVEKYDFNWCRSRNYMARYVTNYTRYIKNTKNWLKRYKWHYNKYKSRNRWWANAFPSRYNSIAVWTMYRAMYKDAYDILAVACDGGGNAACKTAKKHEYYYKIYLRYSQNYMKYYNRWRRSRSSYYRRLANRYKGYADRYNRYYKDQLGKYKKAMKTCIPETNKSCITASKRSLVAAKQRYNERRYKTYSKYHAQYAKYYQGYYNRNKKYNSWWRRYGPRTINRQKYYSKLRKKQSKNFKKIADKLDKKAVPFTTSCGKVESVRFLKKYENVMRQYKQAKKIKELDIAEILKKKANLILKKYARYKGQAAGKYGDNLKKYVQNTMKNPPYVSAAGGGGSMFLIFVIIILLGIIGAGGYFCLSMKPDLLGSVTGAGSPAPAVASE
jgi:hypothetical protein